MIATEILDAARQSARTHTRVTLRARSDSTGRVESRPADDDAGYLLVLLVAAGQARPPAPPRDGAPPTVGSAFISGQITEQGSNRPLTRAIVTLVPSVGMRPLEALTDADGRYEFVALAAGEYGVLAAPGDLRATHLRQAFGRTEPFDPLGSPPRFGIELKAGERRTGVDIALARALAIEGRVLDPWDQPMSAVDVVLTRADGSPYPTRAARLMTAATIARSASHRAAIASVQHLEGPPTRRRTPLAWFVPAILRRLPRETLPISSSSPAMPMV